MFAACESRGEGRWRLEAYLQVAQPGALRRELGHRGCTDRGRPEDLSTMLDAHLLFDDDLILHETVLSVTELGELAADLSLSRRDDELGTQLLAWHALARSLEASGRPARLVLWCTGAT